MERIKIERTDKRSASDMAHPNSFDARDHLKVGTKTYTYFSLPNAEVAGLTDLARLPYCIQILVENALRHEDGETVTADTIRAFAAWAETATHPAEISFFPTRLMLHDVSGIPLLTDLAAMREHVAKIGGEPDAVNPIRPVDFIMDHSVTVDAHGARDALARNMETEYSRNRERYRVTRWAQGAFHNMRVLPPGKGICHQINLEALSRVVWSEDHADLGLLAFPDSLLACDSHTPMINALGILGWGVGAIEALSAMLGEPVSMVLPDVVGVRLTGRLREGTTTTDLVLALTRRLREHGVVQKFVEFTGPGLDHLTLPERATLANMAPEYGASVGYFPIDDETLNFLRLTGRDCQVPLVEAYAKVQGLWRDDNAARIYTDAIMFDLSQVEVSLAGPKLPQSQVPLHEVHRSALAVVGEAPIDTGAGRLRDGDIVIAAITSCTNTSNPSVMVAAGLLAAKAWARGLKPKPWVKTSLSPGSRAVGDYLSGAGLMEPLEAMGFHVTGYGCMTCCGGSGDLFGDIAEQITAGGLNAAAVLSGNRNFEGRIHPQVSLAYLASPPLVIAYALLGTMVADITTEPLGEDSDGNAVYLRDIWPTTHEVTDAVARHVTRDVFVARYADITEGDELWDGIDAGDGGTFDWAPDSTYISRPPFLDTAHDQDPMPDIHGAAILALLGDSVTTDHISPGSRILEGSVAGDWLAERGVPASDFSGFLQRRSHHEVMLRGIFNNPHIQNAMTPDRRGGWTQHQPSGDVMTIFAAHERYAAEGRPLIVVAGREYGTGSSRDWAARGPHLLGVRAIIAEGFERIHRSNLIGMGLLPLQFLDGVSLTTLGLDGRETVDLLGLSGELGVHQDVVARFTRPDALTVETTLTARLDTRREIAWFRAGGVMPFVARRFRAGAA